MPRYIYPWQDPHRHINETISSWKRQLQDQDEHTLGNVETSVYENRHSYDDLRANSTAAKHKQVDAKVHCCNQALAFPPRPALKDLIPTSCHGSFDRELPAEFVSQDITRLMKRKRQRNKYWGQRSLSSQTYHVGTEPISEQVVSSSHEAPRQHDNENVALVSSSVVDQPSTLLQTQKATEDLRSAIDSLRTKLDTLQPEGLRPCDITAVPEHEAVNVQDDGTVLALRKTPPDDSEMLLSQVATSQRSIYLWEEIHTLIEALISSEDDLVALATAAISELGLERLDDTVLHQVCVNEIFNQVQDDHNTAEGADVDENPMPGHTKATQLSYQVSTTLLRVLFFKKAVTLKAIPSRLFLDALLHAGRSCDRALLDSVILPLIRERDGFSKQTADLVQKVMKDQTSSSMIYFVSRLFDPAVEQSVSSIVKTTLDDTVDPLPVLFLSEIHLATIQNVLGYKNVPCPLPVRLWTRFNSILNMLWMQTVALVTTSSLQSQQPSIAEPAQAFLKLYCPSALEGLSLKTGRSETPDAGSEPLRLSNPKLIQLLMTWIIRQGPTCPDVESLQALRQFCAMKLEVKMAKGLVVKLDAVIKKKSTQ